MLTAIIIDDEKNSSEYLNNLLTRYFVSQIHVCDTASNIQDGVELIRLNNPDIVFLDIEMPNENGFKLFDYFNGNANFEVVFTTAHEEYAIKAIKNNAFDYLLKPVDKMDIMSLLKKYENRKAERKKSEISLFNIKKGDSKKIALTTQYGTVFIEECLFLYAKAGGAYCEVHTIDGRTIVLSKPLGEFEAMTSEFNFFRTHKSYIINLDHISELIKKDEYQIVLKNNLKIPLSIRRRDEFLSKIS